LLKELVLAVNVLSHLRNVEWIAITPEICLTASLLIEEYNVSPFDAYHVATALFRDKTIVSSEHVYDKIKGITRIEPLKFAKGL